MPVVRVERTGVRPAPREVPTDATLTVLPMTFDHLGQEASEEAIPARVSSVAEAFLHFRPHLDFVTCAGEEGSEFAVELDFRSLEDFDPKRVRSHQPGKRNDLANLQSWINLLHRMRDRFVRLPVRRAWENPEQRLEIVQSVRELGALLVLVAGEPAGESRVVGSQNRTQPVARTMLDIVGARGASEAIQEIFNVVHPAPPATPLDEIFTRESVAQYRECVASLANLLSGEQSYEAAVRSLDAATERAEGVRDRVLTELYRWLRPIERSYRQVRLFFENSEVRDSLQRPPVELYVLNADPQAIRSDVDSSTIVSLDKFVRSRNDSFNFRQSVCNLVAPGYVPDSLRKRLEDIANTWGMLFIGDLRDEPSFRKLSDQFRTDGGAYEFLKRPEDKAASNVVLAGWVKLRDRHWFEEVDGATEDSDLYAPSSLLFAGCLARTDRTVGASIAQGPVGMIFAKIRGVERARIEPRISQMEHLSVERQIVAIIRNEDNDLCFVGSRSLAEDPNGVLKFFTSYRILRYLERRLAVYLRRVAEQRLTRGLVVEQVRAPIEQFLEEEKKRGTVYGFDLDIDMNEGKWAIGQLDIHLEVRPVGPAETFHLQIDTPTFRRM
jgi:hypothetical protein